MLDLAPRRVLLIAAFLALAGGCVQQVNVARNVSVAGRNHHITYEGPRQPVVRELPDGIELRFDGHTIRVGKGLVTFDQREVAIDPESESVDIRISRERVRVLVSGKEVLYQTV